MKLLIVLLSLWFLAPTCAGAVGAQDRPAQRKPVPQLTTDDVIPPGRIVTTPEPVPDGVAGATGSWARRVLNDTRLSAEMPRSAAAVELPFGEGYRSATTDARAYAYAEPGKWVLISVYLSGPTPAPDAELIVAGLMQGVEKGPGVSDVTYSLEPGLRQATRIKGGFSRNGTQMSIEGIVMTSRNNAWIVVGQFLSGDAEAEASTSRIVSSVRIENQK
jgi:hypothetical protein